MNTLLYVITNYGTRNGCAALFNKALARLLYRKRKRMRQAYALDYTKRNSSDIFSAMRNKPQ